MPSGSWPYGAGKAPGAADAIAHVAQVVGPVRVLRVADPGDVPELRRQQVAAEDPFGVLVVLAETPAPEDEGGLEDVAGVVHLPLVGAGLVEARSLYRPADLVPQLPEPVVEERLHAGEQGAVPGQVGELGQRRHDAGRRVHVAAEALDVVGAVLEVDLGDQLLLQGARQLQGRTGPGDAEILDQRPDAAADPFDDGAVVVDLHPVLPLHAFRIPAAPGNEVLEDRADARLGQVPGPLGVAVLHQRVQGVEALAYVVVVELHRLALVVGPLLRQGEGAAEREEGGARVLFDRVLVDLDAGRVLGVQQAVEMPPGYVVLDAHAEVAVRPHRHPEEGDVPVVCVEEVLHGVTAEADRRGNVGGVDVTKPGHRVVFLGLEELQGKEVKCAGILRLRTGTECR